MVGLGDPHYDLKQAHESMGLPASFSMNSTLDKEVAQETFHKINNMYRMRDDIIKNHLQKAQDYLELQK